MEGEDILILTGTATRKPTPQGVGGSQSVFHIDVRSVSGRLSECFPIGWLAS